MNGEINTFVGFQFKIIESRDEGGLTIASGTDVRDNWAWHRSALGLAIGIDVKTEVNYVPERTSWLCNGVMKAGAVSRDDTGFVKVQSDET